MRWKLKRASRQERGKGRLGKKKSDISTTVKM